MLSLLLYCHKNKVSNLKFLDIVVVGLILAQAIGRWGNFFNQEAYGSAVSLDFLQSLHLPQLESNQAIDDYIKIIQEKLKIERIKQLEQELSQTYDPRQQAKILQEIIESKDKE